MICLAYNFISTSIENWTQKTYFYNEIANKSQLKVEKNLLKNC